MAQPLVYLVGEDPRVDEWARLIRESRKLGQAMFGAASGDAQAVAFFQHLSDNPELDEELSLGQFTQEAFDAYNIVLRAQAIVATEEAIEERLGIEPLLTVSEVEHSFERRTLTGKRPVGKTFRRWLKDNLEPVTTDPICYRKCDALQLCLRLNGNLILKRDK